MQKSESDKQYYKRVQQEMKRDAVERRRQRSLEKLKTKQKTLPDRINKFIEKQGENMQYYLDAEEKDKKHKKEPLPIIHTGVKLPPRKCKYCGNPFNSLRELYGHLKQVHPDKPVGI